MRAASAGVPEFEQVTWVGYFAPSKTPAPVVARLREAFEKVVAMPQITQAFEKRGLRPMRMSARETEDLVSRDIDKWTQLIRSAGISVD